MKRKRAPRVEPGERQDDQVHHQHYAGAEAQAAHQRVLRQEREPAACRVIHRRGCQSDKEVQEDTQNISACASLNSLPPQQASGDVEWDVPSLLYANLSSLRRGPNSIPPAATVILRPAQAASHHPEIARRRIPSPPPAALDSSWSKNLPHVIWRTPRLVPFQILRHAVLLLP